MPRRRYKLFLICAAVFCFMLYRVYLNSWIDHTEAAKLHWSGAHPAGDTTGEDLAHAAEKLPPVNKPPPIPEDDRWKDNQAKPATKGSSKLEDDSESSGSKVDPGVKIPELKDEKGTSTSEEPAGHAGSHDTSNDGNDSKEPPSWQNPPTGSSDSTQGSGSGLNPTKVHWKKVPERFPVPEESLITLPTGKPKQIPKVQYDFAAESADAKTKREQRLKRVKSEISRSWAGYKKFAWMHDELSPVSGRYRDPFCGWAATLVDSLDTLWIAGLKEEFGEAAKAVAEIDFTWSPRHDIPVFETTIRYLGGLIAAYDVSGGPKGSYPVLLDKAIELAEILMGIFDTPNRMPILYYNWKPDWASQPHRASRVGIAELGTLSMEFTRLAQITGKQKYYDAVDRITNALVEFQAAGSKIPGLFPENLDASGCNRTATQTESLSQKAQQQVGEVEVPENPEGHVPGSSDKSTDSQTPPVNEDNRIHRRGDSTTTNENNAGTVSDPANSPPFAASGQSTDWDCVPQGLVAAGFGHEMFHVGGSQDSVYEYFPKQYLLLGGLEPKYKKLHEDTIDAINKWLMYRPMTKDSWDVLFPAKLNTYGSPETDATKIYEVTHLTCFVGGMFGLGGKIFGREKDIETAKKLTDGCVWAYQTTPSGLMPESFEVVPCPTLDKCEFNETLWYDGLDSSKAWREDELAKWEKQQELRASLSANNNAREDDNKAPVQRAAATPSVNEGRAQAEATPHPNGQGKHSGKRAAVPVQGQKQGAVAGDEDDGSKLPGAQSPEIKPAAPVPPKKVKPLKQGPATADEDDGSKIPSSQSEKIDPAVPVPVPEKDIEPLKQGPTVEDEDDGSRLPATLDEKVDPPAGAVPVNLGHTGTGSSNIKASTDSNKTPEEVETPKDKQDETDGKQETKPDATKEAPSVPQFQPDGDRPTRTTGTQKPMSHKEYVEAKVKNGNLYPGVASINAHSYILRPEAIESVWYMYRITGDPEWMEKGWKMFESTIQATRTEFANGAVDSVMVAEPTVKDEMESFWLAETLKYYFLLFSEPDVISLDEWVLNTEAHPFRRPT